MNGALAPIPFLPPLADSPPLGWSALTLTRLLTTLGTVAMTANMEGEEAMVVFRDRAPVVAVARRGSSVVTGQAAIEAVAAVPLMGLRLYEIHQALAARIGAYFLPTTVSGLPAEAVVPELFLRSLTRPGHVACVIVQTADDLGLAFVDGNETVLAYTRSRGAIGGVEQLAGLFDRPDARLIARTGSAAVAQPAAASQPAAAAARVIPPPPPRRDAQPPAVVPRPSPARPPAPAPENAPLIEATPPLPAGPPDAGQEPAPRQDALAAFLRATRGQDQAAAPSGHPVKPPSPPEPPPLPPPPPPRKPAPASSDLLDAVLAEVRAVLGRNSVRVEDALRSVEPTPQAIEAAVRALRDRGVRLIRAEKLDEMVERTVAVLRARGQ